MLLWWLLFVVCVVRVVLLWSIEYVDGIEVVAVLVIFIHIINPMI